MIFLKSVFSLTKIGDRVYLVFIYYYIKILDFYDKNYALGMIIRDREGSALGLDRHFTKSQT